jgi:HEPN domain-containing protein
MQREPLEIATRWLEQAEADLEAGTRNRERPFLACFLSQQSAEKALKGLLYWLRGDHQRIHLIATLLDECATAEPVPRDLDADARTLDKYYTTTRYPDVLDYALPAASFSVPEADAALAIAQRVIAHARERLRQSASTNPQP